MAESSSEDSLTGISGIRGYVVGRFVGKLGKLECRLFEHHDRSQIYGALLATWPELGFSWARRCVTGELAQRRMEVTSKTSIRSDDELENLHTKAA